MRPNQPLAKLLIQLRKQAPSRHARHRLHSGTVAHGSWGELIYGVHSAHGLCACPFDRPSTPAARATPRSEVGRDAKVVPSNEHRDGLRNTLLRARRALRGSAEVGPMSVGHGEKPVSAATRPGASGRAARTAKVPDPCTTGRNLARLLRRRHKSSPPLSARLLSKEAKMFRLYLPA